MRHENGPLVSCSCSPKSLCSQVVRNMHIAVAAAFPLSCAAAAGHILVAAEFYQQFAGACKEPKKWYGKYLSGATVYCAAGGWADTLEQRPAVRNLLGSRISCAKFDNSCFCSCCCWFCCCCCRRFHDISTHTPSCRRQGGELHCLHQSMRRCVFLVVLLEHALSSASTASPAASSAESDDHAHIPSSITKVRCPHLRNMLCHNCQQLHLLGACHQQTYMQAINANMCHSAGLRRPWQEPWSLSGLGPGQA
jgi:hypothetical protein